MSMSVAVENSIFPSFHPGADAIRAIRGNSSFSLVFEFPNLSVTSVKFFCTSYSDVISRAGVSAPIRLQTFMESLALFTVVDDNPSWKIGRSRVLARWQEILRCPRGATPFVYTESWTFRQCGRSPTFWQRCIPSAQSCSITIDQ